MKTQIEQEGRIKRSERAKVGAESHSDAAPPYAMYGEHRSAEIGARSSFCRSS